MRGLLLDVGVAGHQMQIDFGHEHLLLSCCRRRVRRPLCVGCWLGGLDEGCEP